MLRTRTETNDDRQLQLKAFEINIYIYIYIDIQIWEVALFLCHLFLLCNVLAFASRVSARYSLCQRCILSFINN